MSGPRIWAHRGSHRSAVENTLEAFRVAIEEGAHGAELDVRATADGEVVVFHDQDLSRLAGDARELIECAREDLPTVGGAPIPSLDEALDLLIGAGLEVNVEIKAGAEETARVLGRRSPSERDAVVVSSFSFEALQVVSAARPDVRVAYLFERADQVSPAILAAVRGVHPNHRACDAERVREWRASGHFINVWTVNDPEEALRLAALEVDGLVTDEVPSVRRACEMRS